MQRMQAAHVSFQSSGMRGRPSMCIHRRQAGRRPEHMQRMQAAHVAVRNSEMRGRLSFCISRRQAGRRPELMQRMQKARVAFLRSNVRGRLSICTHRHEVGKCQTAKTVAISLKCSIVCRTQHIFHGLGISYTQSCLFKAWRCIDKSEVQPLVYAA